MEALKAYATSGLIHGTRWRQAAVALLTALAALPLRWHWPHRYLLVYDTFNTPPARRWANARRALDLDPNDLQFLARSASAAKEVDPQTAAKIARHALAEAERQLHPAEAAWATFSLSFALRWLGQLDEAEHQAQRLADGFDAIAKPVWIAWGHFELGALAALRGDPAEGARQMEFAREVFVAAGNQHFVFDALCGAIAAHRLAGELDRQRDLHAEVRRMIASGERSSRFAREVSLVEDAEMARLSGNLDTAEQHYRQLIRSPTIAQELLGLLGLGEVQRRRRDKPIAAWRALSRSADAGFGFGTTHAAVTPRPRR